MWFLLIGSALANHPFDFVRVLDPDYPGAISASEAASVRIGPPESGVPWEWESMAQTDEWVDGELLGALNADTWHQQGHGGSGVKIAVFDLQWFGNSWDEMGLDGVQSHDCWVQRSCEVPIDPLRPTFGFEEGAHGIACAQIIRSVAPEAELHVVRVNGQTTLENAVAWAIREEVDVISMSLSFFQRSFYDGTGPIAEMMQDLHEAGILMVTSAGNYASSHWRQRFVDADGDGRMDFDGSNRLRVWYREESTRGAYVSWNQFHSCGLTDLDVVVRDDEGNILGRSETVQQLNREDEDQKCEPIERARIDTETSRWVWMEVLRKSGPTTDLMVDIIAPGGRIADSMASGSIVDPGADPRVLTVGAVNVRGYLNNDVEVFSSQGPVASGANKPDLAGPDGVSVPAYGGNGFFGTSAATPVVAGLVAVVMSEDPTLTPIQAADRLKGWAWSSGGRLSQKDPRWGAGKARLPIRRTSKGCGTQPHVLPLLVVPFGFIRRIRRKKSIRK